MNSHLNENDFNDFKKSSGNTPPEKLSQSILNSVNSSLKPSNLSVSIKFLFTQLVVGILSLSVCPQFKFSLTSNEEVFHLFHKTFGMYGCMFICGTIFIGSGALFTNLLLSKAEINRIHTFNYYYYISVGLLALGSFHVLGANVHWDIALSWLTGAIIGGLSIFEITRAVQSKLIPSPLKYNI